MKVHHPHRRAEPFQAATCQGAKRNISTENPPPKFVLRQANSRHGASELTARPARQLLFCFSESKSNYRRPSICSALRGRDHYFSPPNQWQILFPLADAEQSRGGGSDVTSRYKDRRSLATAAFIGDELRVCNCIRPKKQKTKQQQQK